MALFVRAARKVRLGAEKRTLDILVCETLSLCGFVRTVGYSFDYLSLRSVLGIGYYRQFRPMAGISFPELSKSVPQLLLYLQTVLELTLKHPLNSQNRRPCMGP